MPDESWEHVAESALVWFAQARGAGETSEVLYEVGEDRRHAGDWRVEAINHAGDGEIYVAIFTGSDAERRARAYATRMNG